MVDVCYSSEKRTSVERSGGIFRWKPRPATNSATDDGCSFTKPTDTGSQRWKARTDLSALLEVSILIHRMFFGPLKRQCYAGGNADFYARSLALVPPNAKRRPPH